LKLCASDDRLMTFDLEGRVRVGWSLLSAGVQSAPCSVSTTLTGRLVSTPVVADAATGNASAMAARATPRIELHPICVVDFIYE